jgi:hypothetical protein
MIASQRRQRVRRNHEPLSVRMIVLGVAWIVQREPEGFIRRTFSHTFGCILMLL